VIPTDTVKNTIYFMAKKHGVCLPPNHPSPHSSVRFAPLRMLMPCQIKTIEEFALLLAEHFLTFYNHVSDNTWTPSHLTSTIRP
jgi:urate oxidase